MKKLLALCLSALVLVGCSSNNATTTETTAPETTEATVETTAPATEEAVEETTAPETTEAATEETAEATTASYTAGTYTSTVDGMNGEVTIEVTFSDSAIESINIVEQAESEGLGDVALETVTAAILEAQSTDVDTVSEATVSSEAAIAAVEDCIAQATAQ